MDQQLQPVLTTLNTLIPVATSIIAVIGGVPTPVTAGLQAAQIILPLAEKFILEIGNKEVTIDTNHANDATAIMLALGKAQDEGWPVLSFTPLVQL